MSRGNVEAFEAMWRLWQDGRAAWIADLDPQVEWDISRHPLPDFPDRGQGRDALLRYFAEYLSGWLDYTASLAEVVDAGDDVITVLRETARMRDSDALLERERAQVWTFHDGKIVMMRAFATRRDALDAVGLRE